MGRLPPSTPPIFPPNKVNSAEPRGDANETEAENDVLMASLSERAYEEGSVAQLHVQTCCTDHRIFYLSDCLAFSFICYSSFTSHQSQLIVRLCGPHGGQTLRSSSAGLNEATLPPAGSQQIGTRPFIPSNQQAHRGRVVNKHLFFALRRFCTRGPFLNVIVCLAVPEP